MKHRSGSPPNQRKQFCALRARDAATAAPLLRALRGLVTMRASIQYVLLTKWVLALSAILPIMLFSVSYLLRSMADTTLPARTVGLGRLFLVSDDNHGFLSNDGNLPKLPAAIQYTRETPGTQLQPLSSDLRSVRSKSGWKESSRDG